MSSHQVEVNFVCGGTHSRDQHLTFRATVPLRWDMNTLRHAVALFSGVAEDDSSSIHLKIENDKWHLFYDAVSPKSKKRGTRNKRRSSVSTPKVVSAFYSTSLLDLGIQDGDSIWITNWSKFATDDDFDTAQLTHTVLQASPSLDDSIELILANMFDVPEELAQHTHLLSDAEKESVPFQSLLDQFGFKQAPACHDLLVMQGPKQTKKLSLARALVCRLREHFIQIRYAPAAPRTPSPAEARSVPSSLFVDRTQSATFAPRRLFGSAPTDDSFMDTVSPSDLDRRTTGSQASQRRRERRRQRRRQNRLMLDMYDPVDDLQWEMEDDAPPEPPVGVKADVLNQLPVQSVTADDVSVLECCRICLLDYEEGDRVMRLPCMHAFHVNCITRWLATSTKCPQDMTPLDL